MADLVTFGEGTVRLSPPRANRLETASRFDAFVGGPEGGVAVAAAQLGAEAVWLSKLPNSPLGRRVVREIRGHGVRTGVAWTDADEARVATHYLERADEPRAVGTRHGRAGGSVGSATPEELPLDPVREARAFEVSGATAGLSDRARTTIASLLETASEADTATVFDATYRADLWDRETARETFEALFPLVDVLVVSRTDAVEVLGTSDQPVELAHSLATSHDFQTVLVTRADGGALAHNVGEVHERSAVGAETADPVGVHEALAGGFLAARLDGASIPASLDYGTAAAALKRTVEGDLLVTTPDEVEETIRRAGDD